ncbi:MAG TPA: hypothetical protein VM848_04075 [Acidimicrobiia bacterium]|nr:hypothetical protein [Acidimicrobiia bacterium]
MTQAAYRPIGAYASFPLGALLGGWIASRFSSAAAFSFGGVLVAILAVFMVRNLGRWNRNATAPASLETEATAPAIEPLGVSQSPDE